MQISFEVLGAQQLSRNLRVLATNLKDTKGFFNDSLDLIKDKSDEIFSSKGGSLKNYKKWQALSNSTLRARQNRSGYYKKAPNNPSELRWTGNLQDNVSRRVGNDFGRIVWNAPYAIYHQTGGGKLPQRAIVELNPQTNAEITKLLQSKIQKDIGIFGRQI